MTKISYFKSLSQHPAVGDESMGDELDSFIVIRTVESIQVGNRHRKDLGDINSLAESIKQNGLFQPITVTPEGVLVCGARRLAAIKQLEWNEVRVWVRSGISTRLGHMLAEQNDNALHKPLSQLEAAELYREMKSLLAEEAALRKAATQFSSTKNSEITGPAESAEPQIRKLGDARRQAAEMITGASSYTRLEEINFIQRVANDENQPEDIRSSARAFLNEIGEGAPVNPRFTKLKELLTSAQIDRDVLLHRIAEEKLAEIKAGKKLKRRSPSSGNNTVVEPMTVRAFVLTWKELGALRAQADPVNMAHRLTSDEAEMFFTVIDQWVEFADKLHEALEKLPSNNATK